MVQLTQTLYYTCIACITIDSVKRIEKKLSTGLFRRMQIKNEIDKNDQFIKAALKSESESQVESGIKLKLKSDIE